MCTDISRWVLGCTPEDKFSWSCKLTQWVFLYFKCDWRTTQTLYHLHLLIYGFFLSVVCLSLALWCLSWVPVSHLKQMLASQLWWAGLEMVKYTWRLTRMWCECGKTDVAVVQPSQNLASMICLRLWLTMKFWISIFSTVTNYGTIYHCPLIPNKSDELQGPCVPLMSKILD